MLEGTGGTPLPGHGHKSFEDLISNYPAVHVVGPEKFDLGTAQTPGSERLEAIAPKLGVETAMWGGLFEVAPSAHTGIHHHGEQQTIAYVLSGICEVRWGEKGEYAATAKAGDFIHVPAFLVHMEINLSNSQPFRWVVVRSTSKPIVINLPDDTWPLGRTSYATLAPASAQGPLMDENNGTRL